MNYYVRQVDTFELGNFINCTPTIQAIYKQYKRPVPVLFENEYLADVFKNAPFMYEIFEPYGKKLFTSRLINSEYPDWKYIYNHVAGQIGGLPEDIPHTYIDAPNCPVSNHVVILRGCLQPWKFPTKDPGDPVYFKIITELLNKGYECYFIGSDSDREHSKRLFKYYGKQLKTPITTLRQAVGYVNHARYVVGNDTGLVHAAAALRKKTFCMWGKTLFEKNRTPGDFVTYSKTNHINDFKAWIKIY